jgi:hypothetical protein
MVLGIHILEVPLVRHILLEEVIMDPFYLLQEFIIGF